jgi:hypothetical protein
MTRILALCMEYRLGIARTSVGGHGPKPELALPLHKGRETLKDRESERYSTVTSKTDGEQDTSQSTDAVSKEPIVPDLSRKERGLPAAGHVRSMQLTNLGPRYYSARSKVLLVEDNFINMKVSDIRVSNRASSYS